MTAIVVTDLVNAPPLPRITLDAMPIQRQEALPVVESGPRRRVWCKAPGCRIELTDPISRMRGLGPEHDPEPRRASRTRFDIDQDAIPGL
jgi:hypothetical protein